MLCAFALKQHGANHTFTGGAWPLVASLLPPSFPAWMVLAPARLGLPPSYQGFEAVLPALGLSPSHLGPPSRCSNRLPALFLSLILPLPNFLPLLHWLASLPLPLANLDLLRVLCPSVVSVSVWASEGFARSQAPGLGPSSYLAPGRRVFVQQGKLPSNCLWGLMVNWGVIILSGIFR